MNGRYTRYLLAASAVCYVAACLLPIFREESGMPGIMGLIYGWMGILDGASPVFSAWLANLVYIIAFVISGKYNITRIIFASVTILLGLTSLAIKTIPLSEGGAVEEVTLGPAFYFWMVAFVLLLFHHIARYNQRQEWV